MPSAENRNSGDSRDPGPERNEYSAVFKERTMNPESMFLRALRISWPLLGGAWGAVAGFGGYLNLTHNVDSFANFFAQSFFIIAAIVGLFAGMACGLLVGGLTEKLLRYLGIGVSLAVCVATLVNALVLWQLVGILQTKYPGFQHPVTNPHTVKPYAPSTATFPPGNPCAQPPPPENSKERANWDAECR